MMITDSPLSAMQPLLPVSLIHDSDAFLFVRVGANGIVSRVILSLELGMHLCSRTSATYTLSLYFALIWEESV